MLPAVEDSQAKESNRRLWITLYRFRVTFDCFVRLVAFFVSPTKIHIHQRLLGLPSSNLLIGLYRRREVAAYSCGYGIEIQRIDRSKNRSIWSEFPHAQHLIFRLILIVQLSKSFSQARVRESKPIVNVNGKLQRFARLKKGAIANGLCAGLVELLSFEWRHM